MERQETFERQQKEYEAEAKRREKAYKVRLATLERIVEHAPAVFSGDQLRLVLQILLNDAPYGLFEEAAEYFAPEEESHDKTDEELLSDALGLCADEKLPAFLLRLILSEHRSIPSAEQTDWLEKAASLFAPAPAKPARSAAKKQKGTRNVMIVKNHPMPINPILVAIDLEISRLQAVRKLLTDSSVPSIKKGPGRPKKAVTTSVAKPKKRVLSAEARARIAAAQKKRWAASKKATK